MNTKNPIKNYLMQSVRTNGKTVLLALFSLLIVWVAVAIMRTIPAVTNLISERLLREFVVDLPVKFLIAVVPFIIIKNDKSYAKWKETNPDSPITKKDFTTATYLNYFLFSLTSMPVLAVVWATAGLNYTLQFIPYLQNDKGDTLAPIIGFLVSFGTAFGLQMLFYQLFELPRMATVAAIIIAAIGLVIFLICRPITARLYEKFDL